MPEENLETILEELNKDKSIKNLKDSPEPSEVINDDNVNDYLMKKIGKLIETGLETVEAIQNTINSGFEADELIAFSGLISSVTNAADTLNKINLQNKKSKTAKELKQMEVDAKLKLPKGSGNTNVLIATREEVIERFLNKHKPDIEPSAIDIESESENDTNVMNENEKDSSNE